jgi:hypothetical protein
MSTGAVVARILTQYSDKGSKQAQKDIAKLGKQIDAFGKKAAKSFKVAIVATAALSVKIGKDAVEAAIADSKSQLVLANAMMNTTGATKEAIAVAEEYVKKTMLRVNVADEELRASLTTLYVATQDITEAQKLQTIALDVAAATGKDLQSVTIGITKAQQGNVGALKKLSPELSGLIGKTTKFEDIMAILGGTYAGTAEQLASLDPLKKLQLAYGEVLETLGFELLPVITEFVDMIVKDVLPVVEEWVKANGDTLRDGLRGAVSIILSLTKTLADLAKFYDKYDWVVKLAFSFLAVGRAAKILGKVTGPLSNMFRGLSKGATSVNEVLSKLFVKIFSKSKDQPEVFAGVITVLSRVAKIVGKAAAGFVALGTAGIIASNGLKSLLGLDKWPWEKDAQKQSDYISTLTEKTYGGAAAEKYKSEVAAKAAKRLADARAAAAAKADAEARAQAARDAKAAKDAAKQAAIDKKNAALRASIEKKYGVKITDADEYENIQLSAVEKLQAKQKDADATLAKRIQMRKDELALFQALNSNAQRYTDLLMALADEKLSNAEIELLAKKWGLTVDAAKSYIFTIFAIKDEKVSEEEVDKLAAAWGITKAQAAQYLDFFAALNDGKLSDLEIANLMKKWGLTKEEALKYADFISKIGDGKLDDKEIENLKSKWGLTTQQVVDYIIKIGGKVDASGTILSAGDIAALGWTNALNALNAYLAALKGSTGGTPVVVPPVVVPVIPGKNGTFTDNAVADALAKKNAEDSAKAAAAYASAKAKGDMDAAAKAAAGVGPSALAAGESGAIGAASIAAQLRAAEQAKAAADAAARQASSLAAFKAKEAADAAAAQAAADAMDYDEKFRMRSMQGVMSASSGFKGLSAGGSTNVTVNVAGSVTSENDLVQTVRNGLLRGQYNGQSITLEAI